MDITLTVLEKSSQDVIKQVKRFMPRLSQFQIDVADGQLVPNTTAHPKEYLHLLPPTVVRNRHACSLQYDFHLMVINPAPYLELITHNLPVHTGCVLVHTAIHPNMEGLRKLFPSLSLGLVINAYEDLGEITKKYNLNDFSVIQIMAVEIGFQGSRFLPETLNKVEQLRTLHYRNKIYIDGGVNETSITDICKAPYHPDTLCVGSYLIRSADADIENRIRLLKTSCA